MATMPVERGKIREYAIATASASADYLTADQPIMTPTFLSSVVFWDEIDAVMRDPRTLAACRAIGIEPHVQSLLSLEQEYLFHGTLPRAGDVLETSHRIEDVETKAGRTGPMVLTRYVVSFHDQHDVHRADCIYTSAFVTTAKETSR